MSGHGHGGRRPRIWADRSERDKRARVNRDRHFTARLKAQLDWRPPTSGPNKGQPYWIVQALRSTRDWWPKRVRTPNDLLKHLRSMHYVACDWDKWLLAASGDVRDG